MADPVIIIQPAQNTVTISANAIAPIASTSNLGVIQLAGDLSGTATAPTVAKIQGTTIQAPPGVNTKFLAGDGSWQTGAGGVQVGGDIGGTNSAPTVISTHLASPLPIAQGGTSQTTQAAALTALAGTQVAGRYLRSDGTNTSLSAIQAADVPVLNQNTTGTAANVTGVVAIANGGSGQSTQQNAINALTGTQVSGKYLRSDGTNATLSSIQAADVPTLNQNTTGTASNVTGTVAIANGGTGQTSATAAYNALSPMSTLGDIEYESGANTAARLPGNTTTTRQFLNQTGTGSVSAAPAWGALASSDIPYPAWVFSVLVQGAKGDGKISNTGATNGTTTVTIGESVLTQADVGKVVLVKNALQNQTTSGQTTSVGTITAVNSPTSFTATWNTTPTLTATSLQVLWATDDTTAIQAAIAAANTYAQNHGGYAEIFFPPSAGLFYGVGGSLKNTDGTNAVYNSQLTIPVNGEQNNGVTLVFRGPEDAGQTRYWNADYPVWNGCIQSFGVFTTSGNQSTSINNGGNPSVIGGPTGKFNYGVLQGVNTTPTYTNTCLVFQDFTILTTHSNAGWTYSAWNAFGCARFHAKNFAYGTNGVVQFYKNSPNLGDFTNVTLLSGGLSVGGLMPSNGNNASNYLQNVVCNGGYTYGLYAMEHTVANSLTMLYCWSGVCPVGSYNDSAASGTVSALHAMYFDQACVEGCTFHINIIGTGQSGIGPIIHMVMDTEGTVQLRDSEAAGANTGAGLAAAMGEIRLTGSPSTITVQTGTGAGGLGTGLRIIKEQNLPGVPSSGIPSLVDGTSVENTLWRPATVYLSGGTNVTTVAVSRLAGGVNTVAVSTVVSQAAGALPANTPIRLGPGQWIKVTTSAGTLPTAVWVLD